MDLDLATFSSTTSRQTMAEEESEPSFASPTLKRTCQVIKLGKSEDGGGMSACFVRNDLTLARNGVTTLDPEAEEGKVRKS